jgi:hypothetical protein
MSLSTQNNSGTPRQNGASKIKEMCVFAMLAAIMFASKLIMEALPNVHLLGMLTMAYTVAFRKKALIPLYLYIIINGIYAGFAAWWIPYLYVWTVLWGLTMLIPKNISKKAACIVYPALCCIHGLAFGIIYAPGQALMYGFNLQQTIAWIGTGLYFDLIHGVSNIFTGLLVLPLSELLKRLMRISLS